MTQQDSYSSFFTAIMEGRADDVRSALLEDPVLIDASYVDGDIPLHLAILCDWPDVVVVLLEYGAAPTPALWPAVIVGNEQILRSLFEAGADPNYRMSDGETVAQLTAEWDNGNVLKLFLDYGVDANLRGNDGATLLHVSRHVTDSVSTATLIEYGGDPLAKDNGGDTPLHIAARENDLEMATALLATGANPMVVNNDGYTPLAYALLPVNAGDVGICDDENNVVRWVDGEAERSEIIKMFVQVIDHGKLSLWEASALGYVDRVESLLDADPTLLDAHCMVSYRPLHYAVFWNQAEVVRCLLNKGTCVGLLQDDDYPPLSVAAKRGHLEIVEMLIRSGANVDELDELAYAPLHNAIHGDHSDVVCLLLEHGANPNICSEEELNTPLLDAAWKSPECTAVLIQAGVDVNVQDWNGNTPLHMVGDEQPKIAGMLIRAGADLTIRHKHGKTPLMEAITQHKTALVKVILDYAGYDSATAYELAALDDLDCLKERLTPQPELLGLPDHDYINRTLLHCAAETNASRVAEYLLKLGADPNCQDSDANTPLHLTAESNGSDVAKLLLDYGADPNIVDNDWKRTPLFEAAYHQNHEVARMLIDQVADVNARADDGYTPLDSAQGRAMQIFLRRHGAIYGRPENQETTEE